MEVARQIISNIKREQWIFAGIIVLFALATYATTALVAFPFFGWRGIEIFALAAFFAATFLGYKFVRREHENSVSFRYSRLLRRGLPIFFTGLALAVALFYNASPAGRAAQVPRISEDFANILLVPVEYGIRAYVADFRKDMKISEIPALSGVGTALQEYFSGFAKEEQEKTIVEFFTALTNEQLNAIISPYKQLLPFVYVFGLFLVFRAIGMPLMWLAMGIGWVAVKILLVRGILKLEKVRVLKEGIVL